MTSPQTIALAAVAVPALAALGCLVIPTPAIARQWALILGLVTALAGLALCGVALGRPSDPVHGAWLMLDPAGGILLGVDATVGAIALIASPAYLTTGADAPSRHGWRLYYTAFFAFWSVLLAIPLAGNLGSAWLLVEATTAASALLVGFSGRPRALEAGWKYLILTSVGLGVALLGLVVLEAAGVQGALTWADIHAAAVHMPHEQALLAYVLLLAGLAAKIGWAPVHNWLPDAHSEAPPPISALLSAALLPSVLLVAWRVAQTLTPAIGAGDARRLFLGFGLVSLAVAVPFLWRPLAWKRLLAYSSLEHMGVIALGLGFGSPLALAGVAVHIAGHAIAKTLGFVAATPLIADQPTAAGHAAHGIGRTRPGLAAVLGISLGTLAGIPPSPLFVSEVMILAGGFDAGEPWAATVATLLLALGFLGLAHALLELLAGRARRSHTLHPTGLGLTTRLGVLSGVLLLALSVAALALPGSAIVAALGRGVG